MLRITKVPTQHENVSLSLPNGRIGGVALTSGYLNRRLNHSSILQTRNATALLFI